MVLRMLRITALASVLLVFSVACSAPEADAPREVATYSAETFHNTTSFFGNSFSHDESRLLVSNDSTGIFNVYAQPWGGGEPTALTTSTTDTVRGVSWFPTDDRFLYMADQGGNELNHVYVQEEDGSVIDLTPGEGHRSGFAGWSYDRSHFFISSNERNPQGMDIYRYATDGYERELVFENDGSWFPGSRSRDGKWLALNKLQSNADSDIYLYDLETGEQTHITPHDPPVSNTDMTFTPDSSQLIYSTDGHGEFRQMWSYDIASGEHAPVVEADWDVSFLYFSETGKYRVTGVNADAQTKVTVLNTESGEELALPELPAGDLGGVNFSRSETKLAFYLNSDTAPSNLYVYDLEAGGDARRLTSSLNPAINEADLVDSEVVRFASYDGLEIPAILWRPHQASADNPVPALVWVHGGPGGQTRAGYSANIQHLVNNGYAVFAVNNRGSSGYGKTFFHMDDRKHGDVDLKDCVAGRDYLAGLDWIDGEQIGIIGGSYGGFMVAAALAFEPEVFDVGIDIFGVTNWLRTMQSIPPWWGPQRDALIAEMGDPETDAERLRAISPLFHAANIVKPLLVIQGANDPRVLQAESDELVAAAKANGTPVDYVLFPDEGHGFSKKANRITASEKYVEFLESYLRGDGAEATSEPEATVEEAATAG